MSMFDKRKGEEPGERGDDAPRPPARPTPPNTVSNVSAAREVAMIGTSITIRGDVTGEESLAIHGTVDGTVVLKDHDLTIGPTGLVTASVRANVVRIEGRVTGDIEGAEKVVITRTGNVRGNIVAPGVTLEDGAKFKGRIDMDPGLARNRVASPGLKSVSPGTPSGEVPGRPDKGPENAGG